MPILGVGAAVPVGEGTAGGRFGSNAAVLEEVEAEGADGVFRWKRLHGGKDKCQAVGNVFVGGTSQGWGMACKDKTKH